jgi:hypothetical protein
MTIYFLQPFPETRSLSNKEAHVFKEEDGGIFTINEFIKIEKMHFIGLEGDLALRFRSKEVE